MLERDMGYFLTSKYILRDWRDRSALKARITTKNVAVFRVPIPRLHPRYAKKENKSAMSARTKLFLSEG